jgi:hypothetical protein
MLDRYCVVCHNDRLKTAGLLLDRTDVEHIDTASEVWEKVVRKLRAGAMPPAGNPRPPESQLTAFAGWLERELDHRASTHPNPGSVPAHRLNRAEYERAIRDLLHLDVDSRGLLPVDDSDRGFDNIAGVLSVSPVLLEQYLIAARRISRDAIGDPHANPGTHSRTYSVPKTLYQDDRMAEDLPFGSRGGIAIHHQFPADGEYDCAITLRRTMYGYIRAFDQAYDLEIRLDGARVKVVSVGGHSAGTPAPVSFAGNIPGDTEWENYMLRGDADLHVRFAARAGTRLLTVSFVRKVVEPEGVLQPPLPPFGFSINESATSPTGNSGPAVDSVAVAGPYGAIGVSETPSRRAIFVCAPLRPDDEEACARRILTTLARRAYRRRVTAADERTLLEFYRPARRAGGFEAGIEAGLERILVDPDFLFRIERDPVHAVPGTVHPLSATELASRLSFFLWSSVPDDALLDLATRGRLADSAVLDAQVHRMLADPRSDALVDNFATQWLSLRQLQNVSPDPERYADFDENLRSAFQQETKLLVASTLREDRSIFDLLRANYTFVNERLARHYGIPNVYGNHFRRVELTDGHRGGLLAQGSILTVTAYPNRTSPVLRGRWLLENVLGSPPPPPPANVPALKDRDENGRPASVRERMEQHRRNPVCATCHVRMDPLGFALENFDPIGKWRTTSEAGTPIDANAVYSDGTPIDGLAGLRGFVLQHQEDFARTVVEKLLTYALGRGLESDDMPAVRAITRLAATEDYRWSAIVLGVVRSVPFQMRRAE